MTVRLPALPREYVRAQYLRVSLALDGEPVEVREQLAAYLHRCPDEVVAAYGDALLHSHHSPRPRRTWN